MVKLLITIISIDENIHKISKSINEISNAFNISFLGRGTARKSLLRYLGLSEAQKEVMASLIPANMEIEILRALNKNLKLYLPGNGIAFTTQLSSISKILNNAITTTLTKQKNQTKGEVKMDNTLYDLIVCCVNPEYIDEVVLKAIEAGATGGTIINARGIDNSRLEDFIKTSIQTEQEILLIITLRSMKNTIMKSIMDVAGFKTDGGAILFSLPVDNLIGLGRVDDELIGN